MKQLSLAETNFLSEMEMVFLRSRLEGLIEPLYPKKWNSRNSQSPIPLGTMLPLLGGMSQRNEK